MRPPESSEPRPLKILMTLMGMEIGGAETHVLELSKALKRMGVDVHVVSNGGVYVKELLGCGIKHYRVPLHNRQFLNLLGSYKALRRIIKEHGFRLVHAHARIPAFICGLLQKRLNFRLITTAHFDFSVRFPFNLLSNWGDRTLAVSSDIKEYLLANYGVEERNISLTVNGIDTDRFSAAPGDGSSDPVSLIDEMGFSKTSKKILSVSRLDRVPAAPAHALLDIAEELYLLYDVEIIIVGQGDEYPALWEKAAAVNGKMGHKFAHMAGQRTDVNRFMRLADIFVNVSRAALEAMSCRVPVVLAGGQGYLGLFGEGALGCAMATNFTCRGFGATSPGALLDDLKSLLGKPRDELERIGAYGRDVVLAYYSTERMARDALDVYLELDAPATNIVVSGYYGYDNSGDDILLKSIVENLRGRRRGLNITVLSKRPKVTKAKFGVNAVHRFNLAKLFFLLRGTHVLVTGGGNLIQDETSTQSLLYYLWLINTARRLGAKNMLYSKGIGPIKRESNVRRARRAIERVDMLTLREPGSLRTLDEMGIACRNVHVTADAAFALPPPEADDGFLAANGLEPPYLCISLRSWMNNPPFLEEEVAKFADYMHAEFGYQIVLVPMQAKQDSEISKRVIAEMLHPALYIEPDPLNLDHERMVLGMADFALCMRLHGLIYALENGVPSIGLVYGPKVRQLMESMGLKWHLPVESADYATLVDFAEEIHENSEEVSRGICESVDKMRALAAKNTDYLLELIDAGGRP